MSADTSHEARTEILDRIRRALGDGPRPEYDVPRTYRDRTGSVDVARFVERVGDYRAEVRRCTRDEVEAAVAGLLPDGDVVAPGGLGWPVPARVRVADPATAELDALAGVVTGATVAIAETGTIVLTHGPGEGRRAMTLVPDLHICIVGSDQIVADVPAAFARLGAAPLTTWVSGPSATSDIELQRVEGVHGPRTLRVVVVDV
ncbi:MAG: lactate utilization protein C [Actinomycetales bacterium]